MIEGTTYPDSEIPIEYRGSGKPDKAGDVFRKLVTGFFDSIQVVVIALAIFVVVYLWILSPHQVRGPSMMPTFYDRELLLADKITVNLGKLKRGDVIIFKYDDTQDHIKRIIGLGGDRVMVKGGKVYVNGSMLNESYLPPDRVTLEGAFIREGIEYTVPEGQLIVMGDNRPDSSDSRAYGYLDPTIHTIKGRAWIVYYPFEDARVVERIDY